MTQIFLRDIEICFEYGRYHKKLSLTKIEISAENEGFWNWLSNHQKAKFFCSESLVGFPLRTLIIIYN